VTPDETEGEVEEQQAPPPAPADGGHVPDTDDARVELTVETLLEDVERLARERDEYLDALRRTQADFENYRKRMMKQQADQAEAVASRLVEDLLPVLDACDGAVQHGATEVEPVFAALLGALEKAGLERIDPHGEPFDPNRHEAVMHEPAADGDEDTLVTDVMRRGYAWKGRVLRAAMVKVRG
jgi:molecular chaperone GrpE